MLTEGCCDSAVRVLLRTLLEDAQAAAGRRIPHPEEVDRFSFKELVREGAERGLIRDVEAWMEYRRQRNITSHIYDEEKARSVYNTGLRFHGDAVALLEALEKRNENPNQARSPETGS